VIRALGTLGMADLQEKIDQNENPEITCQMCGRAYSVTTDDLKELKEQLHKSSLH
jgi:molecular chaperone Hsp33